MSIRRCYCGLNSSIIIFCKYALITPFLTCVLYARKGVVTIHFLLDSYNYQGGTGNSTYKASLLAGQQKLLYHQNYFPHR